MPRSCTSVLICESLGSPLHQPCHLVVANDEFAALVAILAEAMAIDVLPLPDLHTILGEDLLRQVVYRTTGRDWLKSWLCEADIVSEVTLIIFFQKVFDPCYPIFLCGDGIVVAKDVGSQAWEVVGAEGSSAG